MTLIRSFAIVILIVGCTRSTPVADQPAQAKAGGTVTIEIVTEAGSESIELPNIASGTTLEAVMRSVKELPITIRGSGTTAFVERIGNQSTGSSDGWTFKVDGEFANQGIGSTKLTPPTTVRWRFGEFDSAEE